MFFNWPLKLKVDDGISWVIKMMANSSLGSTEKIVDAAPPSKNPQPRSVLRPPHSNSLQNPAQNRCLHRPFQKNCPSPSASGPDGRPNDFASSTRVFADSIFSDLAKIPLGSTSGRNLNNPDWYSPSRPRQTQRPAASDNRLF